MGFLQLLWKVSSDWKTKKARKKRLFYQVDDYLTISSDEYKKVINEIHELLENEHIQFTVYTKDFSLIGSHATKLEGVIQPNGYSYSEAVGQNINWLPFDSFAFPSVLSGQINHWGQLTLRKTKTDYAFLRRVPKKFSGSISKSGVIHIEVTKNDMDDPTDGRLTMGKLIANHFSYDEQQNYEYQIRKNFLIEAIEEFSASIKADNHG